MLFPMAHFSGTHKQNKSPPFQPNCNITENITLNRTQLENYCKAKQVNLAWRAFLAQTFLLSKTHTTTLLSTLLPDSLVHICNTAVSLFIMRQEDFPTQWLLLRAPPSLQHVQSHSQDTMLKRQKCWQEVIGNSTQSNSMRKY